MMETKKHYDVLIIGGSYAGLAAAMALGRALRKVLVIDSGDPCNRQTPYSHNFLTQDGKTPSEIITLAKQQVAVYGSIEFIDGLATHGKKVAAGFEIQTSIGTTFTATKLIFATGIKDILPRIKGFDECWGISVLHCPYCHGYEVKSESTGIFGNGEAGFELAKLISNWTENLILFTNGASTLSTKQVTELERHRIHIEQKEVERLEHIKGQLQYIGFKDGSKVVVKAVYTKNPFKQHCSIPQGLGCAISGEGYIQVDAFQKTTMEGVFACGDNVTRMRTVANAVAMGTTTGMMVNKELIEERFSQTF